MSNLEKPSEITSDAPSQTSSPHRAIKSFVLRQGRMSDAQKRSVLEGMPEFGIPYEQKPLNFENAFQRAAPTILEIGFGMGQATAEIAQFKQDTNFIGVEVHQPGVGNLLKLIKTQHITNLRIISHDAVDVLNHMIPDNSLAGVHIYFPDPWPKARHHKRRLIQAPFIKLIANKLIPKGYIHCATDWENYAEHILFTLQQEPSLQNANANYAERPDYRPLTKFEQRGIKLGHGVWDIIFTKKDNPI